MNEEKNNNQSNVNPENLNYSFDFTNQVEPEEPNADMNPAPLLNEPPNPEPTVAPAPTPARVTPDPAVVPNPEPVAPQPQVAPVNPEPTMAAPKPEPTIAPAPTPAPVTPEPAPVTPTPESAPTPTVNAMAQEPVTPQTQVISQPVDVSVPVLDNDMPTNQTSTEAPNNQEPTKSGKSTAVFIIVLVVIIVAFIVALPFLLDILG